jgi:hypothetical protein
MFRLPSASTTISITALIVALGGAGVSATGDPFILGNINAAENQSGIVSSVNGKMLLLNNQSNAGSATALGLTVTPGHPPLVVNSDVRVANLNADKFDDLDSTAFGRVIRFSYNLAPGTSSAPIEVPPDVPLHVVGTQLASGFRGVGSVALLRSDPGDFLEWTGLESTSGSVITQGFSGAVGTHIVFLDFSHQVDIEVAGPDTIRVTNSSTGNRFGNVTIYQ